MCMICFAIKEHQDYPFVLCSNRDEILERGTQAKVPAIQSDGIICGIDLKGKGTWIGMNSKNGDFSGLTNIGPVQGRLTRGALVYNYLENSEIDHLEKRNEYGGFNVLWGNIFKDNIQLNCASNRDPKNTSKSASITSFDAGIHALGNELIYDEFVKSVYMESEVSKVLKTTPRCGKNEEESVNQLRDQLAQVLESKQIASSAWPALLKKMFVKSKAGRWQAGFYVFTIITALLFLLFKLLLNMDVTNALLYAMVIGFSLGLYTHLQLQYLFVNLEFLPHFLHKPYGTVSQTIIIKTRTNKVYYFFRPARGTDRKWLSFTFEKQEGKN